MLKSNGAQLHGADEVKTFSYINSRNASNIRFLRNAVYKEVYTVLLIYLHDINYLV